MPPPLMTSVFWDVSECPLTQTSHLYIAKIAAKCILRAQEIKDLKEWLSSVHISEEWSEYQEESEEQDIQDTELEANETGNKEELNELSDIPSVGQPKQNMSGTQAGTPAPMARTALASVPTEVVNHKLMVPEPGWFNGDRKTFED